MATVVLKQGHSYTIFHGNQQEKFTTAPRTVTDRSLLQVCRTIGVLSVSEDEDEPAPKLKRPKAKLVAPPVEDVVDDEPEPEADEVDDSEVEADPDAVDAEVDDSEVEADSDELVDADEPAPAPKAKPGNPNFKRKS